MSLEMEWREPPPKRNTSESSLQPIIAELRKHPGKWALIKRAPKTTSLGGTASHLRSRYGCEVKIRALDEGGSGLFARWVVSK